MLTVNGKTEKYTSLKSGDSLNSISENRVGIVTDPAGEARSARFSGLELPV